jgi:hypothetical protein
MSWELCTSYAIIQTAGANVSSIASTSGAIMELFYNKAEGYVNTATRFNWAGNLANLAQYSYAINCVADAVSSIGAVNLIQYDTDGIGLAVAQDRTNVLYDRAYKCIGILQKIKSPEVSIPDAP